MSIKAFNHDVNIYNEFTRLIKENNIEFIVETGTYMGDSTRDFAPFAKTVYTIEIREAFYKKAKENLKDLKNIKMYLGDSPSMLPKILNEIGDKKAIFFLDSHWYSDKSLEREISVLASHFAPRKNKPIILMHDFKVPNRPEFGYDSYGGIDFEWKLVEGAISKLYGNKYTHYYNSEICPTATHNRGCLFVVPK